MPGTWMMRRKRSISVRGKARFKAAVILFLCVMFTAGCGRKSGDESAAQQGISSAEAPVEVKVAFWGSPEEIQIVKDSIAGWQEGHPDIRVRLEHTPYSGYVSKMLTRIAGGAAPDVICTEVDFFVSFASKKVLANLTPFVEKDAAFDRSVFFPEVLDRFTVDHELLAIPRDTAPFACVFYNKDIFDEEGVPYPDDNWTWSELLDTAKRLTQVDENGRVSRYGFYAWAWQNFVYGNGGRLVDDVKNPTRSTMDTEAVINGLQFFSDLINKYRVMPTPVALSNLGMGVNEMFAGGRLAMFLSGIWETPRLRNFDFRWDVAMFPTNDEGIRHFGTGGSGYSILKSSKHPKEAWEVIKALTGPYGQTELAKRGLAQPARIDVAEGEFWAGDPNPPAHKGMLNEAVKFAVYAPFHFRWREIRAKAIMPELDLLLSGRQTAAQAVGKMVPQINRMLASSD